MCSHQSKTTTRQRQDNDKATTRQRQDNDKTTTRRQDTDKTPTRHRQDDKTTTRQRQDNDKTTTRQKLNLCIPMMPFTPSLPDRCERHHRNAQVQLCLVVVLSLSSSGVTTPLVCAFARLSVANLVYVLSVVLA